MPEAQTRAPVPGAALARLLARMSGLDATPPTQSPAERLGDWLEWQRAVALSRALDGDPGADGSGATDGHRPADPGVGAVTDADAGSMNASDDVDEALVAECRRLRAELGDTIAEETRDWTLPLHPRRNEDSHGAAAGATAVQRHCRNLQHDMQAATGRLRGELRERLALREGGAARLAAVDAVMEGLLAPREHALLAPVVPALVARFESLHARHGEGAAQPATTWRANFRSEARQVLLAELDLRFQPIEALLAALRTPRPDA
ncbi:DUF3348 family protein [Luteimonas arsenica]|uniref:DUF3348 family protein n=1 Tax=Luteimonas arsenica TaxID=1586242 RepID=UPI00105418E3|nr:DUF3348 family protein [Luteimonas arsenica]